MAEDALQNARRRREELAERINRAHQEIEECRALLARVDRFIADYEVFAAGAVPNGDEAQPGLSVPAPPQPKTPIRRNTSKEEVARMARTFIEGADRPIPRNELYIELVNAGLTIEGVDPEGVLNTMLWRTKEEHGVIHLRNVGYWLKEREWRPAKYHPELDEIMGVEDNAPTADEFEG